MNTSDSDNAFEKTAFQEGDSKHFSELARLQAGEHPITDPNVVEATSALVEALSSDLDADKIVLHGVNTRKWLKGLLTR